MEISLKDLRRLSQEMQIIRQRIAGIRNRMEMLKSVDYAAVKVQGGLRGGLPELLDELGDWVEKHELRYRELAKLKIWFYERLEQIQQSRHRQALEYRYIDGLSGFQLAEALMYCKTQAYKVLREAEQEFYEIDEAMNGDKKRTKRTKRTN